MDKLIHDGRSVTISNDGATLISLLDIVHPAAKTLVDIAKSQDNQVGDGTTSVVLTAGELLKQSKQFIEEGMHSSIIIKGYRDAMHLCIDRIKEISVKIHDKSEAEKRDLLLKCAMTSLNSKIISRYKEFFGNMVVDAVMHLNEDLNKNDIGIKKITGGSVTDSFLVEGVCFKKTFSYAGFEQQPKMFADPMILILNVELELKAEKTPPKSASKILMTSKKLWTLNGKLFTTSWTRLSILAQKLSSQNSPLVTLLPSTSLIETFFVLAVSQLMIWSALLKQLAAKFKLLLIP